MNKGIIIIHSSDIVRSGLALIIRKYFNIEITQLSQSDELKSFNHIKNSNLIIIMEKEPGIASNLDNLLEKNNLIHKIFIQLNNIPVETNTINFKTSNSEIQEMISEILKKSENPQTDIERNGELTNREKDVLKLVAMGNSNKDIADQLFISVHTVISHRKNITEKLGIKSISGLTVYAILNKIIDTETINPESLI